MKKFIIFTAAMIALSINTYALNFSLGLTAAGFGPTISRGAGVYASDFKSMTEIEKPPFTMNTGFAPIASVILQLEFMKYMGVELGAGYNMRYVYGLQDKTQSTKVRVVMSQIGIPISFKVQYEFNDFANLYFLIGPKVTINMAPTFEATDAAGVVTKTKFEKTAYELLDIDAAASLGIEFKIARAHYVGLRAGYSMNILGSLTNPVLEARDKSYLDNISVSVTYRYRFRDI